MGRRSFSLPNHYTRFMVPLTGSDTLSPTIRNQEAVNTLLREKNEREDNMMGGGTMGGFGGGLGLFGGLLSTLLTIGLLVGLVFLGIWLWRRLSASGGASSWTQPSGAGQTSALDILQARYARGEMTREEYQSMWQDLA
jgi:putative membrane protein